jgi:hypothetical protein
MCSKGFIKRSIPFFLTLSLGLFIASFFITVAAPSFNFKNRGWHRQQKAQKLKTQNQWLRDENLRLRKQLEERDRREVMKYAFEYDSEMPPPPAPKSPYRR